MSAPPPEDSFTSELSPEDATLLVSLREAAGQETSHDAQTVDGPGVLLGLAFVAFVITYALAGQHAAGIAFWTALLGLPALYVVVSALGTAWTSGRRDELLRVATLAVAIAQEQHNEASDEEHA
ncbi:hypothetical protein FHT40_006066 [Mycolicibacterium sp. BK556]|uniref:hypothetical protein n=1 Tax=unclassified Mycolicibacterium TaxID=2636767 RepID=UPI0016174B55|nr:MULTISPECIES: hypothetical protein [unclassified Mycolicibacterium]MBB3606375.1 hypothetical protein [Mycolicibacterium sp. BK556]MBB3636379.1 hypothetical protein [Mycolicibacterium sp. BK607]